MKTVAFKFKIGVTDNEAINTRSVEQRARYEKIWQLNLEKHLFMLVEEECSVNRLDTYDLLRVFPECSADEVECIPVKGVLIENLITRKLLRRSDLSHA